MKREFDRPHRFVDEMVEGAFCSLRHVHEFVVEGDVVVMRDTLVWRAPLGFLGRVADRVLLERYMRAFIVRKQSELRDLVERRD